MYSRDSLTSKSILTPVLPPPHRVLQTKYCRLAGFLKNYIFNILNKCKIYTYKGLQCPLSSSPFWSLLLTSPTSPYFPCLRGLCSRAPCLCYTCLRGPCSQCYYLCCLGLCCQFLGFHCLHLCCWASVCVAAFCVTTVCVALLRLARVCIARVCFTCVRVTRVCVRP